jgi:very-short-patch-repair endonuclease
VRFTEEEYASFIRAGRAAQQAVDVALEAGEQAGSKAEQKLARQLGRLRVKVEREFAFHPVRQWRFDFALPARRVAIEVEGGVHMIGRHQRFEGFTEDCRKYNAAALAGWRVLRFTPAMVESGEAAEMIAQACTNHEANVLDHK